MSWSQSWVPGFAGEGSCTGERNRVCWRGGPGTVDQMLNRDFDPLEWGVVKACRVSFLAAVHTAQAPENAQPRGRIHLSGRVLHPAVHSVAVVCGIHHAEDLAVDQARS